MIRKTIAFFWGNKRMSWLRYMTLYSFCKLNPDWDIRLYRCESNTARRLWSEHNRQDFEESPTEDYTSRVEDLPLTVVPWELAAPDTGDPRDWRAITPSHKSNFFKWEFLVNEGGVYADMDILFVKPMSQFMNQIRDADIAICHSNAAAGYPVGYFSIGLLASSGDCSFYRDVLHCAFKTYTPFKYQCVGVEAVYRALGDKPAVLEGAPYFEMMQRKYPDATIHNIAMSVVYPWPWNTAPQQIFRHRHKTVPGDCVGIHWYAGHPLSQRYNRLLTEANWRQFSNTISLHVEMLCAATRS